MSETDKLRQQILDLVREYHRQKWPGENFEPGETFIPYAGRVFDSEELVNLVDSSLDFWLTTGRYARDFEQSFAKQMGRLYALLCNSGSSANLLAVSALTSPRLGDRRLLAGDEVITVAAGFPTTVNPIVQNNLVPVFIDVDLPTMNADVSYLEEALSPKTRAVIFAHTLGNPFDLGAVKAFTDKHNLFLIEDNCDALGSKYNEQLTGTFGDMATLSFYPAHHITMGEGGCVITSNPTLKIIVESFRDWGRDCYCDPGKDNTCGKRFGWQLGTLPLGYDHKYIYSHIGYNLKLTDMQAAIGVAQLQKLPRFVAARRHNWQLLRDGLKDFEKYLILPCATAGSEPSWFGFVLTVKDDAPFKRGELVQFLESKKIATRHIFGGNLARQPAYQEITSRSIGELANTDRVMNNSFVVGVYPGIDDDRAAYMIEAFKEFFKRY
ncbi:MAG: lipopolysaccharide biosynthesis protein RfbH [Cyanobacteria bacterium SZAS TMP-1]|nr:lipopolysaccharide biosynthesis protein RfbH [Cyanobacteria bacterium SZAS TMP-1]